LRIEPILLSCKKKTYRCQQWIKLLKECHM
jgi:hypothetical protein